MSYKKTTLLTLGTLLVVGAVSIYNLKSTPHKNILVNDTNYRVEKINNQTLVSTHNSRVSREMLDIDSNDTLDNYMVKIYPAFNTNGYPTQEIFTGVDIPKKIQDEYRYVMNAYNRQAQK
jgi:hypothetical protein